MMITQLQNSKNHPFMTEEDIKNLTEFMEKDLMVLCEAQGNISMEDIKQLVGKMSASIKEAAKAAKELWDEVPWEEIKQNAVGFGGRAINEIEPLKNIFVEIFKYMADKYGHLFNEELAKRIIGYIWMHLIADMFSWGTFEAIGLPLFLIDLASMKLFGSKEKAGRMPMHDLARAALKKITGLLGSERDFLEDLTSGTYLALYKNIPLFKKQMDSPGAGAPGEGAIDGGAVEGGAPATLTESEIKRFKRLAGVF